MAIFISYTIFYHICHILESLPFFGSCNNKFHITFGRCKIITLCHFLPLPNSTKKNPSIYYHFYHSISNIKNLSKFFSFHDYLPIYPLFDILHPFTTISLTFITTYYFHFLTSKIWMSILSPLASVLSAYKRLPMYYYYPTHLNA